MTLVKEEKPGSNKALLERSDVFAHAPYVTMKVIYELRVRCVKFIVIHHLRLRNLLSREYIYEQCRVICHSMEHFCITERILYVT